MASRREFIQTGIAATAALVAIDPATGLASVGSARPHQFLKVVYDARFPEPMRFAKAAETLGLPVHPISGDMTALWYQELHGRWKEQPVALAGMTRHGPMFCFEMLARDYGMRLVYQVEHTLRSGDVLHTVSGPLPQLRRSSVLAHADEAWPEAMAELLADSPVMPQSRSQIRVVTRTRSAAAAQDPLFSWVIAPVSRT